MRQQRGIVLQRGFSLCVIWLGVLALARAGEPSPPAPPQKLRVFTVGNSFLNWMPGVLGEIESLARVERHELVGSSFIGASRVADHWAVPDARNRVKEALAGGSVDVLMLGGRLAPDDAIEKFVALGLAHNPRLRVTLQEIWLPFDRLDRFPDGAEAFGNQANVLRDWSDPPANMNDPHAFLQDTALYDVPTAEQIARLHAASFDRVDQYVEAINRRFGRQVLHVVPVGQAVVALRGMIAAGMVPEIPRQSDLFADRLGHPKAVIRALSAYCHFAVVYRRNPQGLPLLPGLAAKGFSKELNRVLQTLAWDAVTRHPASGVTSPE